MTEHEPCSKCGRALTSRAVGAARILQAIDATDYEPQPRAWGSGVVCSTLLDEVRGYARSMLCGCEESEARAAS